MPLYHHETAFIIKKEIEEQFMQRLTPAERKYFKNFTNEVYEGYEPSASFEKEDAKIWYSPDMDSGLSPFSLSEGAQRKIRQALKKFPEDKWLILDTMTKEGMPINVEGGFYDQPFEINLDYQLDYNVHADFNDQPTVELDKDGCNGNLCAAFAMSWDKKVVKYLEKNLPSEFKDLIARKAYCNYVASEEYNLDEEYWGKQMLVLFNVPYDTDKIGNELEAFLKKNIKKADLTLIILPQKAPMNYWEAWNMFPAASEKRIPLKDNAVYYGDYGPWKNQKDPFILTAFHYLHVCDPAYEKENGEWYMKDMLA